MPTDTKLLLAELRDKHVDMLDSDSLVLWAVVQAFAAEIERLRAELDWFTMATGTQ